VVPAGMNSPTSRSCKKDFKGKNIVFVSISLDDNKAHGRRWLRKNRWKRSVYGEAHGIQYLPPAIRLKGFQLFFWLMLRNIIKPNAPRPSSDDETIDYTELAKI
jgi:hypothetical protein